MFDRESIGPTHPDNSNSAVDVFIFLGGSLVFPNPILRIVEQEAGGAHALRLESLRELQTLAFDRKHLLRKVFFDDRLATEVFRDIDLHRAEFPGVDWVLAYRDLVVARRLLDERVKTPRLAGILLLPMTLPICPWSSMLRLVLEGHFIAGGDLIGAAFTSDVQRASAPEASLQMQNAIPEGPPRPARRTTSSPGLTQREKEVLALVSQGGRNKSIAHTMSLSEHTVKLHLHHAITKIGARNRTEAANWYLSHYAGDRG